MSKKPMISLTICIAAASALFVLCVAPRRLPAAAPAVSIPIDTYQYWAFFDQAQTAFERNDFVQAHRLLSMVWPVYLALVGNPDSPFPPDPGFRDYLNTLLQNASAQLMFDSQQYA